MSALMPCPFCGATKHVKLDNYRFDDGEVYDGYVVICDASGWETQERGCGASGGWGQDVDDAIKAWNRRTAETAERSNA